MDISLFLSLEPYVSSGMSDFQMDNFVINDSITPYRKMRQAVIEAKARLETITSTGFDLEELEIKEQRIEFEKIAITDPFALRLKEVESRRVQFDLNRKRTLLEQVNKEATFFLAALDKLVESEFGGAEALSIKMADPTFHANGEADFWVKKLARGAYSDYVNYNTISKGVLESISCLPVDLRNKILSEATAQQLEYHNTMQGIGDAILVGLD